MSAPCSSSWQETSLAAPLAPGTDHTWSGYCLLNAHHGPHLQCVVGEREEGEGEEEKGRRGEGRERGEGQFQLGQFW